MNLQEPFARVHWAAPVIIIMGLVAGLGFATGHHAFYSRLNGKPVDESATFFSQQLNVALGTALALLFRASLTIAIGMAYWQIFWRNLLHQRRPLTLPHVDSQSGALGALFELSNARALSKKPSLATIAVLSWLLPLAALLPPATLSIQTTGQLEHVQLEVPALDSANPALNLWGVTVGNTGNGSRIKQAYKSASSLDNLASTTALQATISHFSPIGTNMTYAYEFQGSALRCHDVPEGKLQSIRKFLYGDCGFYEAGGSCGFTTSTVVYYSWMPQGTD